MKTKLTMMKSKIIYLSVLVVMFSGWSCDRDRNTTGWDYFPDMSYSNAYETYTPNENFEDGLTMRIPVEGTISRDQFLFEYGPSTEERERAGRELVNPFKPDTEIISRGRTIYSVYCAGCHGDKGDGKGHLVTSGLYKYPVRTLISDEVKARHDGELFHTISEGFGVMGAHGSLVLPDDRWKTIIYIRQNFKQ